MPVYTPVFNRSVQWDIQAQLNWVAGYIPGCLPNHRIGTTCNIALPLSQNGIFTVAKVTKKFLTESAILLTVNVKMTAILS